MSGSGVVSVRVRSEVGSGKAGVGSGCSCMGVDLQIVIGAVVT